MVQVTQAQARGTRCWRTMGTAFPGNCVGLSCMAWDWSSSEHEAKFVDVASVAHPTITTDTLTERGIAEFLPVGWEWTPHTLKTLHLYKIYRNPNGTGYFNHRLQVQRPLGAARLGFCGAAEAKIAEVNNG